MEALSVGQDGDIRLGTRRLMVAGGQALRSELTGGKVSWAYRVYIINSKFTAYWLVAITYIKLENGEEHLRQHEAMQQTQVGLDAGRLPPEDWSQP